MAEPQKTDPLVKSKEKKSLLDIDIDKDFLGSWKSMSLGDDGMDFDFGPTTKGKQKAFKFDKMDMDFSLDADFDISSLTKKCGKSKETSKEVSTGGVNRAKRESFAFSFDFDEFADLGLESKKKKIDDSSNQSKDKEGYSYASSSGGSGNFLAKNIDASGGDDITLKHPAPQGVTNSYIDTQMDNIKDPDSRNEDDNLKSVIDESSLLKPANSEEQETQRTTELIQEPPSSEKRYSPEPLAQKVIQDSYVCSEDTNVSTEGTFSDVQEEESRTLVRMVSPSTGDKQNDNVKRMAELIPTENSLVHMKEQSEKGEMCETRADKVIAKHIDGSDTSKVDLHLESYVTPGIENLAQEDMANKRNADTSSKLQGDLLVSGTTIDELATDKERKNIPIQSKYFKKQNGNESELQQASASSTKLISTGNKGTNTLPSNLALEKREIGSRSLESGSKFTGLTRSLPKVLSGDIPVQTENTEASHVKSLNNTSECSNADNIRSRNEAVVTTVGHDIASVKEKPGSKGSDKNTEHISAPRSAVHPSSSIEQLRKNLTLNVINPGTPTDNMRKPAVKEIKISLTKAEIKASEVCRATEPKLKPLNSLLPKSLTSMRNKDQSPELQRNTVFKRNLSVDPKKQTPLTPTLKRKAFEESVDIPRLTPLKRLSGSPCSNNIKVSSEKVVEEQGCSHMSVAHDKSPRLDVSLPEMDIYSSIENDGIFEKAEACSKELEDICNMLKKKHEEANDILVRAIVNNNNLLMLNHPIYQEKLPPYGSEIC